MQLSSRGTVVLFVSALLALSSMTALAQSSSTGTLSGQVVDQQGAAIPGVDIQLTDPSTNITLKTTTNENGRYIYVNVTPATYNLTFTKAGFSTRKVNKQEVQVGQSFSINATLEVGATSSVVEVTTSPGAELQTVNATVGTTVSGPSLIYLPTLGGDASGLAIYQPGVSPEGSVAGAMFDQNSFQLDGGNNSNDMDGSMNTYTTSYAHNGAPTGVMPTPVDSIEEFKVATAGQTADFNGSSGAQIQMVTRRGTNQFHGSAYEYYFASNVGAANSWDNNHTPSGNLGYTPLPVTHNNRYGFSVGGPMLPRFWGGKTYFFFNYEGFNYPQSAIVNKQVPTDLLRAGVIQINQGGTYVPYNINPFPVTVAGKTYQPATCGAGPCDPRGIGINSLVSQIWNKFMPEPNNLNTGDGHNVEGFQGIASLPQTSKFLVGRVDHDFGEKWRLMTSYRYYAFSTLTTNQVDIGGALPGDTLGTPAARAPRPQKPDYLVAGLSTTVSPTITNDFHFSYLKNWWQWASSAAPPQLPGLGGALEIGGESANALIPYNVNNQNVRQRFWDGHDTLFRDDVTKIWGSHVIQFGGNFERNYDYHGRNDNGQGINTSPVYQIGSGPGIVYTSATQPAGLPSSQVGNWNKYYSEILGITNQPQTLYTRSGANLTLNPAGTPMFDQSTIKFYNIYVTDSWHIKPTLTLTYGLGYQVETPPVEKNGKQVELVDTSGKPIVYSDYFAAKKAAALQGQVYNPILGYATIANVVGASHTYPYNPFYGGISPRASAAWNPKFGDGILGKVFGDGKTVIRGGYGQIYSRLNGVGLVLIPLLGQGLGQPVSCIGASSSGQCLGSGGVTPATAFRVGTDGLNAPLPTASQTLPQPYFPGINGNSAAGSGSVLDPSFQPAKTYNFNFSIQREIRPKVLLEVGYIGRIIHNEWQQTNIDAVPYMTTLGGQSFAQAYAQIFNPVTNGQTPAVQPFFEAALGGATSSFCKGYGSCTAAVVKNPSMNNFITQTQVYQLWSALNQASSWTLGRTLPSSQGPGVPAGQVAAVYANNSSGFGNYNAAYTSLTLKDFHGVTTQSHFTYGRALGTGNQSQATSGYTVLDPFNVRSMYGPQFFDYKFIYSQTFLWSEPWFRQQKGVLGHLLGGWRIAPIFTARSGAPLAVNNLNGDCESFGEGSCATGSTLDGAVLASKFTGGNSANYNQFVAASASGAGVNSNAANGGNGVNMFKNPDAIFNQFRPCILGYDTSCGSNGNIRGLPDWNLDATVAKDINLFRERVSMTLSFQFVNLLNHVRLGDPYLDISDPGDFGVLGSNNPGNGGQTNSPRTITFNLRLKF
jgi:hypothetical protein